MCVTHRKPGWEGQGHPQKRDQPCEESGIPEKGGKGMHGWRVNPDSVPKCVPGSTGKGYTGKMKQEFKPLNT